MSKHPLIGACGLYCGACDNHLAFQKGHGHLLQGEKFSGGGAERCRCAGCHSEQLTDHCRACVIRLCALKLGVGTCASCERHPCPDWEEFRAGGFRWPGAAHRRSIGWSLAHFREEGEAAWLRLQERRWRCVCGKPFSFYETGCAACGAALDSCISTTKEET